MSQFKPNTLIAYHGGGYDGCIWEWNWAYIDDHGTFHSIYHSGLFGCETLEKLERQYQGNPKHFQFTDMGDEAARDRFADEESVTAVGLCSKWFADNGHPDYVLRPKCDKCERRFPAVQGHGSAARCVGGVEMAYSRIVCDDCYDPEEDDS